MTSKTSLSSKQVYIPVVLITKTQLEYGYPCYPIYICVYIYIYIYIYIFFFFFFIFFFFYFRATIPTMLDLPVDVFILNFHFVNITVWS